MTMTKTMPPDLDISDSSVEEYRIGTLEKKVIQNQNEIMKELRQIREELKRDHERIIKLEVMYSLLDDKFKKQESYTKAITTTVIAQILLFVLQMFSR